MALYQPRDMCKNMSSWTTMYTTSTEISEGNFSKNTIQEKSLITIHFKLLSLSLSILLNHIIIAMGFFHHIEYKMHTIICTFMFSFHTRLNSCSITDVQKHCSGKLMKCVLLGKPARISSQSYNSGSFVNPDTDTSL